MKKLLPPTLFLIFAVSMGFLCWGFQFQHHVEYPYNLIGLPLLVGGLMMAKISKKLFLRLRTNVNTFADPDMLITSGLFQYTRNPMYLGFVVAIFGVALLYQGAISSFVMATIFFIITDRWYIRFEERVMREKFGEKYQAYCEKTRRWV